MMSCTKKASVNCTFGVSRRRKDRTC
uniref:Uncharacterized protein n=1 Tax=Arundo donax TaxID=35708 RepID=A0A0A8ZNP5_ARUDO